MSIVTKVPYILTIMLTLSKAEKEAFTEALNTSVDSFVEVGFLEKDKKISELQSTVTCVALRTSYKLPRKLGYLIKKSNKVHFLCFSENPGRNQLVIYEVVGVSLIKIDEFLDAEELRNILVDEGQSSGETPATLLSLLEGDTAEAGVNVDLSEDGKKVKITLDQDVKDAISGNNTVNLTFADDDWDEDEGAYVKKVEFNNTFIKCTPVSDPTHDERYLIYCPYFKFAVPDALFSSLSLSGEPETRYVEVSLTSVGAYISVFNGLVQKVVNKVEAQA